MTSALTRRLGAVTVLSVLVACSRGDARPQPQQAGAAGGEVSKTPATPAASATAGGLTDSISTRADIGRIRGSASATVWLVEGSDFQCSFCKQWHDETFATIDRDYVQTGKVRLAYLNYPIPQLHPNARVAAEAAMCASVQGKFWEMHDSLFTTQLAWAKLPDPTAYFDAMATKAGVAPAAWRSCMTAHATIPLIDADHERLGSSGVQSTPTFFVGDRKIEGAQPIDSFRVAIEQALAKARGGR